MTFFNKKKIVFVTGSRADYGKLKPIIFKIQNLNKIFESSVFVTGMHNLKIYGSTYLQIKNDKIENLEFFNNQKNNDSMDVILSKTIKGFSKYIKKNNPDLIVIHGDRIEPLACAIVGCLNNIKVAHLEGGEISGTVDEILRHSISKLAHLHFVSNKVAKNRLIQMGENKRNIFVIGSPDIDIMLSNKLPSLSVVKKRYNINFSKYSIFMFHPVTTEIDNLKEQIKHVAGKLIESKLNYVTILPNNDSGSKIIVNEIKNLSKKRNFKILPSMRFEHYLTLLKNSKFIVGNSSSGIMEAPYYGTPTVNIGSRQKNRSNLKTIKHISYDDNNLVNLLKYFYNLKNKYPIKYEFGYGDSSKKFVNILKQSKIWKISSQKQFVDL